MKHRIKTMKEKTEKTNCARILERMKIPYEAFSYPCEEFTDGLAVASLLGLPAEKVYKTLVTVGKSGQHYVFVIPVAKELDRKKSAAFVGEKAIELLPLKELFALTGYVRGGCTAVGMKKKFPTVIDISACDKEKIYVSGGRIGLQFSLSPKDLLAACDGKWALVTKEEPPIPGP